MPAVPRQASATAAETSSSSSSNNSSSRLTMAKGNESLASIKGKEAAFYGVDTEDFTDRVASIMTDYVEGAMQDVKRDFCRTVAATGGGKGKKGMGKVDNPEAFYEETVAPCAHSLIDRLTKRLDRRADAFEMYLARNIFKIPKTEPVGKEDAMDVDGPQQQVEAEEEEEEEDLTPPCSSELPTPQAEDEMDEALTELRVKIRTLRRQRKAVEALLTKATIDLDLTQKEAYALRLQFLQTLNMHPKLGPLSEALETLAGQGGEVDELISDTDALLPALERRRRQDAGEEDGKEDGKEGGVVVLGSSSSRMKKGAAGSGLTDIRTNTKEDLTMLIRHMLPGTRA